MEKMDPNMERQVWVRVFARPQEPPRDDLRALMLLSMEQAAAYRQLANMLTGRARERARQLYEGEQANLACLKGMRMLSGIPGERAKSMNLPREPAEKLLEKCYHRCRRGLTEYTARTVDGEFGAVFQKMAQREGEHCALIAELLGTL